MAAAFNRCICGSIYGSIYSVDVLFIADQILLSNLWKISRFDVKERNVIIIVVTL